MNVTIFISPSGKICCEPELVFQDAEAGASALNLVDLDASLGRRLIDEFRHGSADGLLMLATPEMAVRLPIGLVYWRDWSRRFLNAVTQLDEQRTAELEAKAAKPSATDARDSRTALIPMPDDATLDQVLGDAPPMRGLEYLGADVLRHSWFELENRFRQRLVDANQSVARLLSMLNPEAHMLGRVTFHLAENKRDPDRPFAFLATYAHRMSAKSQVRHLPLAEALRQYANQHDQNKLAELLTPVREAASRSPLVGQLLQTRALFQPQAWSISQAYQFLKDVAAMEQAGLIVRVPDWWKTRRPARPQVQVRIGEQSTTAVGLDRLLDFSATLALDGVPLTDQERQQLLSTTDGLTLLRGKWVEVDQQKLDEALKHWQKLERQHADGVTFLDGMRLLAGTQLDSDAEDAGDETAAWSHVVAGAWLSDTLRQIRDPSGVIGCQPGNDLQATLRPYQADGVRWLWFMTQLGLGTCLADDMGLGKTIQVIDLILQLKREAPVGSGVGKAKAARQSHAMPAPARPQFLLVVPASLLGNWKQELERFAPQLRVLVAHRSECDADTLARLAENPTRELADFDILITTYTQVRRAAWLAEVRWRLVVLDEAQAIKNPNSAQSKSVRKLSSAGRVALTGTPVENQLADLWSIFDFCCPGLLGSITQFRNFVKLLNKQQDTRSYGALRRLVRPYILRRMKTDSRIIQDLPDKTELRVDCGLTKVQAALYEQVVRDVAQQLELATGIKRHGLVLSMLLRLKQLCNHPSQFLNQTDFRREDSGKFLVLSELCRSIAERQEKMLVFTQFQSMCQPLADYLETQFGRPGLVLHGGVPVTKRKQLVRQFQEQDSIPYFVISVKAGGTGLNLTAASHVVHFDRWWNPAVENQATDRAFRIGQTRNVLVHKFVCKGTLEERIDQMIRDKSELADAVLGAGGEKLLTEMSDADLLRFVALDVTRASLDES